MVSTVEWLRGRTDTELVDMLAARPDLLLPAPPDLATLARRMDGASAARRAIGTINAFELQLLRAVAALTPADSATRSRSAAPADCAAPTDPAVAAADVALYLGGPASRNDVIHAADRLELTGLLYRSPKGELMIAAALREAVDRLFDASQSAADSGSHPFGPAHPVAPALDITSHTESTIDGTAAGQALAAHAVAVRLLEVFGTGEVTSLKAGGITITAVRRLSADLGLPPHLVTLYIELLHAAGLIGLTMTRAGRADTWLPSQSADLFLDGTESAGWALLASTWTTLRRDASKVGVKDEAGKIRNALSTGLDWRSGGADRQWVLETVATADAGSGASHASIAARLAFSAPTRRATKIAELVDVVLSEATELGIIAFDALSTAGRSLLSDDIEEAASALESAAPAAVDSFMVQADMTIIAAGRLGRELRDALALTCEVESKGSATVYRITESSVRRALDAGAGVSELHALLADHSATGVPQSVSYLIDDVARRHGSLRAGAAGCYIRSDDAALVAEAIAAASSAGVDLRLLAPTVAVSGMDLDLVVSVLRAAGLAPAAEDSSGSVLDLRPRPHRTRIVPPPRPSYQPPGPLSTAQIAQVVARLRAGGAQQQHPRDVMDLLRSAARERAAVWIGYADQQGSTSRRCVEPITVSGGSMVAFDRLRDAPRTFAVHRISSVTPDTSDSG